MLHIKNKAIVVAILIVFTLTIGLNTGVYLRPVSALPILTGPVLSVSSDFHSKPLLGGTTTVSVTITNTGEERGYNLSLEQLFSAEPEAQGKVSFESATLDGTDLPPSTVFTDEDGLHLKFTNFTDLEPTESMTIRVTLRLDEGWAVGDMVQANTTAVINPMPDDSGEQITQTSFTETPVIPITVVSKTAHQSTGVEQATGTEERQYHYTITVQNNYLETTNDVVVLDQLPDGLEFLGLWVNGEGADTPIEERDPTTGITKLRWEIGDRSPGATWEVKYLVGVRYDFYGTDNGGTNRPHDQFQFEEEDLGLGSPVPNKKLFSNIANLEALFHGLPYTDSDSATITAAYATINKGVNPGTVGNGTVVTYTINYYTSEYYEIDEIIITDILPDGQGYIEGSASIEPATISFNDIDGTTTLTWHIPGIMDSAENRTITFQAIVQETWVDPPFSRENIVAGDSMTNRVSIAAQWHDQVTAERGGATASNASASVSTGMPHIAKQVSRNGVTWVDTLDLTVGDEIFFRIRFNTADGTSPQRSNIRFGDISIVDWLPPGISYIVNSHQLTYLSDEGVFIHSGSQYNQPPEPVRIGNLDGLRWWLGDIEKGGWWQVVFQAEVTDIEAVAQDVFVNNHAKLAGENSLLRRYSDRDVVNINYSEPLLRLTKDIPDAISGQTWVPGEDIRYNIEIENTGGSTAWGLLVEDFLPLGMRELDPTESVVVRIDETALTPDVDYTVDYAPETGVIVINLVSGLAPGSSLTISYLAQLDDGIGAGTVLTNLATVGWYSQSGEEGRNYPGTQDMADANTDEHTIQVRGISIEKSGPVDPITIGDTLTYTLDITVPGGTKAYWPEVSDRFSAHGIEYLPESASLTHPSGLPLEQSSWQDNSTPISGHSQGRTLTWRLKNYIDNSGVTSDYVFRLTYQVVVTGVHNEIWEFWLPSGSDALANTAAIRWSTVNTDTRSSNRINSSSAVVAVHQPYLTLSKEVLTDGPFRGGVEVDYKITVANNGNWPAYNVILVDRLPQGLISSGYSIEVNNEVLDASKFNISVVGDEVTIQLNEPMAAGSVLIINCTGTIVGNIGSGATLTNLASVEYSSQAVGGRYIARTDSAADINTDEATINVEQATIEKIIYGPNPATIGDQIEYVLRVTVPAETVAYLPKLTDIIDADGMSYVLGSAVLSGGDPSRVSFVSDNNPTVASNSPGMNLTWNLNTVDNTGTAENYVFELRFRLEAKGLDSSNNWLWWVPGSSDWVRNQGGISWNITADPTSTRLALTTEQLTTIIHQPYLVLTKSRDKDVVRGGDKINYTVTIENTGQSGAHRLIIVDDLPLGLEFVPGTFTVAGEPLIGANYDSTTRRLTIDLNGMELLASQTMVVSYEVQVDGNIGAGSTLTNRASVAYSSRPGDPARNIEHSTNPNDDNTAHTTVSVAEVEISKSMGTPNPATIGDEVEYVLTVTVPAETVAYLPKLTDIIDGDGMSYVQDSTVLVGGPSPLVSFKEGNSNPVITSTNPGLILDWNFNTISNTGTGEDYVFQLRFRLQVTGDSSGTSLWWLPGSNDRVNNQANFGWNIRDDSTSTRLNCYSSQVTTDIHQPYLILTKARDKSTVKGGETINYTVNIENTGLSSAHRVTVIDDLPLGLMYTPGSVTVTVSGAVLTVDDYTVAYNSTTRRLTIDLNDTYLPVGPTVVTYQTEVIGGIGAGSTLTNLASVEYSSLDNDSARHIAHTNNPSDDNTAETTVAVSQAQITKIIVGPNPATIGQVVVYKLGITVPAGTIAYQPRLEDLVYAVGMEYVPNSASLVGTPSGVQFSSGSAEPGIAGTNPITLTWNFDTIDNSASPDQDKVFELQFSLRVMDLDSSGNPLWWPQADSYQVRNRGRFSWNTSDEHSRMNRLSPNRFTNIHQPFLVLTTDHDATAPLAGGDEVQYTLNIVNQGLSQANSVVIRDIMPPGVAAVVVNSVILNGQPKGAEAYEMEWDSHLNHLTFTLTGAIPAGQTLVVTYTASLADIMPAGSTLTNIASVAYNSLAEGSGRHIDWTPIATDANTDAAVIQVAEAAITKSHNAPENKATIGDEFTYSVQVTVPSYTTLFEAVVTDTVADGLTVLSAVASIGSVSYTPELGGTTMVTWTIGEYTNNSPEPQTLIINFEVRVQNQFDDGTLVSGSLPGADVFSNLARLSWKDSATEGNLHQDTHSAPQVTIIEPTLTLIKDIINLTHPGLQPEAGDRLRYTISVANTGTASAYGVKVTDPLAAMTTYVLDSTTGPGADDEDTQNLKWNIETVAAGETIALEFEAIVEAGVAWGENLNNTATLDDYYNLPQPNPFSRQYASLEATAVATARAAGLVVQKTVMGSGKARWLEEVEYRVTVSNVGNAAAYGVNLTDVIPHPHLQYIPGSAAITWSGGLSTADPIGNDTLVWNLDARIDPGEELTLIYRVLPQLDTDYAFYTNTVTALAVDGGGTTVPTASQIPGDTDLDDKDDASILISHPNITVTKTLNEIDGIVPRGDNFTYTIRVENDGNTSIPVVPLTDTFNPAYMTFVSGPFTPLVDNALGIVTWADITEEGLAPGQFVEITVTFKAAGVGTSPDTNNTATVATVDEHDNPVTENATDSSLTITGPEITVTKVLNNTNHFVPVGEGVSYTIRVTNSGTTSIPSLPLVDTFDSTYLTFVSATFNPIYDDNNTLTWGNLGPLDPGQYVDITVVFTAAAIGATPQTDNTAQVTTLDQYGDPVADSDTNDSLTITQPGISVTKLFAETNRYVAVGANFSYTIQVTNTGNTSIPAIPLVDNFNSSFMTLSSASLAPDHHSPGLLTWIDITGAEGLDPGDSISLTVTFRAVASGYTPQTDNTVLVEAVDQHGNPVSGSATDSSVIITSPSITVIKTLDNTNQYVPVGNRIIYTIKVTNTGDTIIPVVPLVDTFDSTYMTFAVSSINPTASGAGTLTWADITQEGAGLEPGNFVEIIVEFTAVAVGSTPETDNTVTVNTVDAHNNPVGASDVNSVLIITRPDIIVTKTLVNDNPFVPVGGSVYYTISVENSGNTVIPVVPLVDTFASGHLDFVEGSFDPASGSGTLTWDDITQGQELKPGDIIVLNIEFLAVTASSNLNVTNTALVSTSDEHSNPVTGTDSNSTLIITRPEISVTKVLDDSNGFVPVGDNFSYTVRVTNTGNTAIPVVPLIDNFDPAYMLFVSGPFNPVYDNISGLITWTDITMGDGLGPDEFVEMTVMFTALAVGTSPETDNAASVTTVDLHGNPVTETATDSSLTITRPRVVVTKTLDDSDGFVPIGAEFSYTIKVTNSGNTTIPLVPLSDSFNPQYMTFVSGPFNPVIDNAGGFVTWTDITQGSGLAPDGSIEFTVLFKAEAAAVSPESNNLAVVASVDEYGDPIQDTYTDFSLTITNPLIEVAKALAPGQAGHVKEGDTVTFQIILTNTGNTDLFEIPLRESYDKDALEVLQVSVLPSEVDPGQLVWSNLLDSLELNRLEPGATINLMITFRTLRPTTTLNIIYVDQAVDEHGHAPPPVDDSAQVVIHPNLAQLAITKSSSPPNYTPVMPGDLVTYTIQFQNISDAWAHNVTIQDYVEESTDFVPGSIKLDGVAQLDSLFSGNTRMLTLELDTLAPGQGGTLVFQVQVKEYNLAIPDIVNVAVINSDQTEPVESYPAIILPVDPFEFTKVVRNLRGKGLLPGDILEWVITVRNTGHAPTTNIIVTDPVPKHTTYVAGSITGRGADDSDPSVLRWAVGSLAVDEEITITFHTQVDADLEPGMTISNQASLTSDQIIGSKPSSGSVLNMATEAGKIPKTGTNTILFWISGLLMLTAGVVLLLFSISKRKID